MTIGGPAATFARQFRHELFPATPMLLAGVDRRFVEQGTLAGNETAVVTQHDPALIIDEILRPPARHAHRPGGRRCLSGGAVLVEGNEA